MRTLFSRRLGYGLLALGLLAGAALPVQAGPLPQPVPSAPALADTVTPVRDSWAGNSRNGTEWRWRGGRHWRGDGGWRHGRHWRGDWNGPRWRRHHHRDAYLGLGLGLGLGLLPSYNNYYVAPRRYHRGLSQAHIDWCYAHYRTYRAWDNTYVPRRGVRAYCRSPFG